MRLLCRATCLLRTLKLAASFASIALVNVASAQVFQIYHGAGVLENAWQDYSWCSDNLQSTAYTLTGPDSVQVTYTGAWQGFYLNSPTSFSPQYFSSLTFSINGGTTANRTISVALIVNGSPTAGQNLNNFISGGHVAAGKWEPVTIPLSAFQLKPTDQISGFWLQESSGAAQPSFYLDALTWAPVAPPTSTTVQVNASSTSKTITPLMFGVNTAVWDSNLDTARCKQLVAEAGFKGFRFPGGSLSDTYNWQTNTTTGTWTWATDFDQFASVAAPYGGQDVITVNYGTGTPAEAAAWVKYANVTKGYGMKYWEVGNEVYGTWETDSHAKPNDPVTYATLYAQYYAQMKTESPNIMIGAVASPGEDAFANYASTESVTNPVTGKKHSGWTAVMLATLAKLNVTPDFIIYHRYPEYAVDCDFTLLAGTGGWITDIADLRMQLNDYLGAKAAKSQIFCTETNSDAGPEGKQMVSLVNGLFLADSFGTMLQTETECMLWWDLMNGINTTGDNGAWLYGWREYGDEGIFSPDLTLIYPMFYVEQMLNLFAASGDKVVSATSSYNLLSAYATKRSDGSVRVLIVNKNPTATLSTKITLSGIVPGSTAKTYTYGTYEDGQAQIGKVQTVTASSITGVSATTKLSFTPYSVTVLVFTPKTST
jgi:alpha-N-arabinofuranosidase